MFDRVYSRNLSAFWAWNIESCISNGNPLMKKKIVHWMAIISYSLCNVLIYLARIHISNVWMWYAAFWMREFELKQGSLYRCTTTKLSLRGKREANERKRKHNALYIVEWCMYLCLCLCVCVVTDIVWTVAFFLYTKSTMVDSNIYVYAMCTIHSTPLPFLCALQIYSVFFVSNKTVTILPGFVCNIDLPWLHLSLFHSACVCVCVCLPFANAGSPMKFVLVQIYIYIYRIYRIYSMPNGEVCMWIFFTVPFLPFRSFVIAL